MADALAGILGDITNDLARLKTPNADARRQLFSALQAAQQEAAQKNITFDSAASAADIAALLGNLDAGDALAEATGVNDLLGGGIIGNGHFESFDKHWIECLVYYYRTKSHLRDFPSNKKNGIDPVRLLEDHDGKIRIAMAGDWGTGTTPLSGKPQDQAPFDTALAVAQLMGQQKPDYTIHLGDVYYSGTPNEEKELFLKDWPRGAVGSYALNSNHEMYDGGAGYFDALLQDPDFKKSQQGLSYFALTNDNWLIVGLDTAFFACNKSARYNEGYVADPSMPNGTDQLEWLLDVLQSNQGKRVIMLTHHDGFSVNTITGEITMRPLYNELTQIMSEVRDWWWYWGHVHNVMVYERIPLSVNSSVTPRCVGHGAIPYLPSRPDFTKLGTDKFKVQWSEADLARKNGDPRRAPNGFVMVTLTGADLHEQCYDEFGRVRWSNY
jgi:Calcineurin-like phosphoesterase